MTAAKAPGIDAPVPPEGVKVMQSPSLIKNEFEIEVP
jgi:hypothetical protein